MTMPPPPSIDPAQVLPFPEIHIVLNDDRPRIEIAGAEHPLTGQDMVAMREDARKQIAQTATALSRPVQATAHEPSGTWVLVIHPDGTVRDGSQLDDTKKRRSIFRRR